MSVESEGPLHGRVSTKHLFLGKTMSQTCLSALLGIGSKRLRKKMNGVPDLRFGKSKCGSRKNTASVDAWLALQYTQIAETLPDRLEFEKKFFLL